MVSMPRLLRGRLCWELVYAAVISSGERGSNRIVPVLLCRRDYVTAEGQTDLLGLINARPWLADLQRRVQHHGYRYDYKVAVGRSLDVPRAAPRLVRRMSDEGLADEVPNQTIVNEYRSCQGIATHVDCVPCLGATILSLSLGSPCVVGFSRRTKGERVPLLVEPVSLLFMRGAARYAWRHGI